MTFTAHISDASQRICSPYISGLSTFTFHLERAVSASNGWYPVVGNLSKFLGAELRLPLCVGYPIITHLLGVTANYFDEDQFK